MKDYSKKILSITSALLLSFSTLAANIDTDRSWYLAGEAMKLNISTEDSAIIAYAELCDINGLAACNMLYLYDGKGKCNIELPADIHSGYYILNAYTRDNAKVATQLVPIINLFYKNKQDSIDWIKIEDPDSLSYPVPLGICTKGYEQKPVEIRETEGHIVKAHIQNNLNGEIFSAEQIRPSLSIVGKQIHYFEGKMLNDTTAVFFTYGLHGKQPLVLSAATNTGLSLPIQMISPFASLLPEKLPRLAFHYQRSELEKRSKEMQIHQMEINPENKEDGSVVKKDATTEEGIPLDYDPRYYGKLPDLSYNLNEYRQFSTINETIIEYVNQVRRDVIKGVPQLVTRSDDTKYDSWPAKAFIDGMPVIDIDRLLKYDARRIQYINIYSDKYTFGNGVYKGIVSFITRTGKLTNYPTEPNVQYLVYEFPE